MKAAILLSLVLVTPALWGQAPNTAERPSTHAIYLQQEPNIDGEVLGDPIWQMLKPVTSMIQMRPDQGQPASESTEIRIGFSASVFYLSVVCFDSQPDKLVVADARRDASLDDTDSFLFILDTYNDGQNGFLFGTNSLGVEYDGQVDNEGQGNFGGSRQQSGVIGGFNLNWDASWIVKAQVGEYGWSAEFAIPFNTLRFNSGENRTWGINFQRNIRKTNEEAFWAPLPLTFDIKRLSLAGKLHGLNLRKPGNLKVIPYVLGSISKDFEVEDPETDYRGDAGVDVKYSVTPSVTLDLTYNTDFAQVEVDNEQVNLDRFNLFFPEKRPFFLENAGQFSIGSPGEVDLFFSRRIGISEEGTVVPIIGGARLSGKINDTYVGLLSMFTEDLITPEENIENTNYTVVRVLHQFAQRSAIGAAFMSRQSMGGLNPEIEPTNPHEYNRTFAMDGRLGLGKKAQLSGFYGQTRTPGLDEDQYSFNFKANYRWNGWILDAGYTEVAENFNPELGFLLRESYRKPEFLIFKTIRAKEGNKWKFLENRPHVSYQGYWNFDDFLVSSRLHIDNHWVWRSGFEIHTGINITTEGVVEDFEIFEDVIVPADTYNHAEAQLVFRTNQSKNVYISTRHILGGSFGGTRYINSGTVGVRIGDRFNSEYTLQQNNFDLPGGKFHATVFGTRLSYSFTPRIFTQGLIQFNSVSDIWSANIRFGWLQQANTGLFVVFNQVNGDGTLNNRSFTVKYSRMFDILH